jgi:6-phosphogluconolactonase (cycloisomerase 2 family)
MLFPGTVPNGTAYFVRVVTQPNAPSQFCSVPSAAGLATNNIFVNVICNTGRARFVYVADHAQNLLYGIDVDTGGSSGQFDLSLIGAPVITGQWPLDPAVVPAGASTVGGFVYVRNANDGTVSAFTVGAALTSVPGSPFTITGQGNTLTQTVISPTGRFIYFLDQGVGGAGPRRIFAYLIQANGALVAIAGSPFPAVDATHRLEIDPLGRYLYGATSSLAGASVTTYRVDPASGALSSVGTPANGNLGLARGVVHPSGELMYVARDTTNMPNPTPNAINVYRIDTATGQLTLLSSWAAASDNQSTVPVMDPQGRFLYVTGSGGLAGFRIDAATGSLLPVPGGPVLVGINVGQIDIEPTGRFLYAPVRQGPSEGVAAYTINQTTGQLTVIPGTPFPLGQGVTPNFLEADASGSLLFVATAGNDLVTALLINGTSGALTFLDSETAGLNATRLAIAGTQ